jgi:outer membrane protein assembly complex protein YaeT
MADTATPAPPPRREGHHRSARERQRRGPMWGCLRALVFVFGGLLLLLVLVVGGGYWYLGTTSFSDLVARRIEQTLANRLQRTVTIGSVEIVRTRPQKVIIRDLRIGNSPGAVHPYFATAKEVVLSGGVESFWGRTVNVERVDVVQPSLWFEIYPAGSKLVHNFPHWQSGPRGRYEIVHLDIGTMFVSSGGFQFLDRKHKVTATASGIASTVKVTLAEDVYQGVMTSPRVHMQIQDYVPFDVDMRGGFRYTPNKLVLNSIALRGRDLEAFLSGTVAPLADAVYNLRVRSNLGLNRIREIFKINKVLEGAVTLDANLRGKQGDFTMSGGWVSDGVKADVYDLTKLRGRMTVTGAQTVVDVDTARYGGGTIGAHYILPTYNEPYPQTVDLRYNGVSLEKLFSDWGIKDTGLRGGATGHLSYAWNKDKVLEGSGSGSATLARDAQAFSNAKYPLPLAGSADFALDAGTVRFRNARLDTGKTRVDFSGSLRIADVFTDLALTIHSDDFSELDRIGYNFAHSAGKTTYALLGLGGAGDITGSVRGKLKTPQVEARILGDQLAYNNVVLGNGTVELRYNGDSSVLTFVRSGFGLENGRMSLAGTVAFPANAPLRFDIAVDAADYPVERAIKAVGLKLVLHGLGTGRLIVTGTPDAGTAHFVNMRLRQGRAEMVLAGDVKWSPGKGNMAFNLDVAARSFPVSEIAAFLDVANLPVTGEVTGTLHLEGPKTSLEGAGAVTVRNGSVMGEPVTQASAEIVFTKGALKATNVNVTAPAGTITGSAELNLNTNQFSYEINSSNLDLSKLKLLSSLAGLLGGHVTLTSRGGGTFEQPELMIQATLNEATIKGLALPPNTPPPTIYLSVHNGLLTIRGSVADVLTVEGDGTMAADYTVNGNVKITISDIARLLSFFPQTQSLPASGNMVIQATLGGKLTALESIVVDATIPTLNLHVADHQFTAPAVPHVVLRNGVINFVSFELDHPSSSFRVTGTAALTGTKALAIRANGDVEAALLQLFVPGLRASGHVNVRASVAGTLGEPRVTGSAVLENAQFRIPGFPQLFDNVSGRVVFRGDRIDIEGLSATLGGGTVKAGGFVTLNGLTPANVLLTLQGTGVAIRYFEGVTVEGDFNLRLSGGTDRIALTGDVAVTRALYFKDFDFSQALLNVLLSRRGVAPVVAASWQDRVDLRLHLSAPNTLAVRNNIADVTGSADIDLNGTLANPVVLGLVTLNEGGRVRFQNIDYTLARGTINFQNPFRIDPYFDITIEGRVSGNVSEIESGPIDVTLNLTGTIDRMTPTLTSDPPASDITLFSLLGLGSLGGNNVTQNASTSTQNGGVAAGTSLLASGLGSFIGSRILPFADTFTIDPNLLDTNGATGARVTFQKRVSNNVNILVVYNLGNHQSVEVVEWTVNPEWTVQFTRDEPRKEYRAEARFRRRYEGHWAWGSRGRNPFEIPENAVSEAVTPAVAGMVTKTAPPAPEPVAPPPATEPVVTQVAYHADGNFDTTLLSRYITVQPGQPLSLRAVQDSIKSLFATGDFRDIRVDVTGGVVTFNLSLEYRLGDVVFQGLSGADQARAERELTIHQGDVLSLNAVDHSAVAVQEMLAHEGYLDATVDPATDFFRDRNLARVTMAVTPGPLAKVGRVVFDGSTAPFAPDVLVKQMKRGPGRTFRVDDARNDAERMERYAVRRDYRKADIRFVDDTYDRASHTVNLRYSANIGPKVRVDVEGVPRSAVRRLIPFGKNEAYSEDAIDRAAQDIVTSYQQRGFYNATVDTEGRLEGDTWVTTFVVHPGEQYRLAAVTFTGNAKVTDKQLASVVQTSTQGGFRNLVARIFRRPTAPTRAQLSADRDAVESFYRLNGFSEAKVATPVVSTKADGTMTVDFPVNEGPQTLVTGVQLEGVQQVTGRDLPKLLTVPGQPLNPANERADVVALQTFYSERGNAEVQVTPRVDITPDKTGAAVTYTIAEGPKVNVGEVVVRGNTYTNASVVLRKSDLDTGEPFRFTKLLEAQRNLYQLGIFQRVEIQPEQAGTSVGTRNVTIQVEEGKDVTVAGSVGATKQTGQVFSPRVSASVAQRNLFGTGRYAGLQLIYALNDREAFLTYREPFIFNFNVPLQVTVFQSDDQTRAQTHIQQRGTFLEASKVSNYRTRWSLRYEYKISKCKVEEKGDLCDQARLALIPGLDRSLLDIKISSLSPTFFWDTRDDPINPHRGFFTSASLEYAFRAFAADADFLKEFAQGAWYLPLTDRSTFVVAGRGGLIQPFGSAEVPLSERFTAGGDTSHRGFPLDLLGTTCQPPREGCVPTLALVGTNKDLVAPVGGNGLLLLNAEYRFPVFSSVGGAVFTDIGNVYRQRIRFNDLRYGIGTGVRYLSPVGPIRFDIGYNLNRRILRFENDGTPVRERGFVYFLTLGFPF